VPAKASIGGRGLKLTVEPAFGLRRWVGPLWPLFIEGQGTRYRLHIKREEEEDPNDRWLNGNIVLDVYYSNGEHEHYATIPVPDLAIDKDTTIPLPDLFTHTPGHTRIALRDQRARDTTYFMFSYNVTRGDTIFLRVAIPVLVAALVALGGLLDRNRDRLWPFDTGSDAPPITATATMTPWSGYNNGR